MQYLVTELHIELSGVCSLDIHCQDLNLFTILPVNRVVNSLGSLRCNMSWDWHSQIEKAKTLELFVVHCCCRTSYRVIWSLQSRHPLAESEFVYSSTCWQSCALQEIYTIRVGTDTLTLKSENQLGLNISIKYLSSQYTIAWCVFQPTGLPWSRDHWYEQSIYSGLKNSLWFYSLGITLIGFVCVASKWTGF